MRLAPAVYARRFWSLAVTLMLAAPAFAFAPECSSFEHRGIQLTACKVDTRFHRLQLFLRDDQGRPLTSFRALSGLLERRGQKLLFAMNAGMFHKDYSPVGLFVSEGRELYPLNLATEPGNFFLKPNGVFVLSASGARIIESSRYPQLGEPPLLATQSGPMLVIDGALHPAFRPTSTSRNVRNGVGTINAHEVVFAISEQPVTFYEFAKVFRDGLGCRDALYLDGTVSSLFAENLQRRDAHSLLGPIIAVTAPVAPDR